MATATTCFSQNGDSGMIFRIAEIEVYPDYLGEYLTFAEKIDRLSLQNETGVICLFPMQSAADSCQIRILEIYRDSVAYQNHLKTPWFLEYKQGTAQMVKSLQLPEFKPISEDIMNLVFKKN